MSPLEFFQLSIHLHLGAEAESKSSHAAICLFLSGNRSSVGGVMPLCLFMWVPPSTTAQEDYNDAFTSINTPGQDGDALAFVVTLMHGPCSALLHHV